MKQHTPPNPHLVRLLIIGAAFLTVTLALILMQPSNSALAELPEIETPYSDTPDDNTVARADTGLINLMQTATGSIAVPSALRTEAGPSTQQRFSPRSFANPIQRPLSHRQSTPTAMVSKSAWSSAQVKPSATISTQFSLATASAQSRNAFMATLRFTRPFLTPTARSYLAPTASARASG